MSLSRFSFVFESAVDYKRQEEADKNLQARRRILGRRQIVFVRVRLYLLTDLLSFIILLYADVFVCAQPLGWVSDTTLGWERVRCWGRRI